MYFPVDSSTKIPLTKDWPNATLQGQAGRNEAMSQTGAYGIALKQVPHIIVVDFDPRNYERDEDGNVIQDDEKEFLAKGWLPPTLTVQTPGGGRHYYYKNKGLFKTRKNIKAYPGVDFLSQTAYVIAPGSKVNGKVYTPIDPNAKMADIHPELLDKIRNTGLVVTSQAPIDIDEAIEELRNVLMYLDSNSYYPQWLNIGISIFNSTQGAQEGLDLWDEWSRSSKKYEDGQCSLKWATFNPNPERPRGLGSLYHQAIKNGYIPSKLGEDLQPITTKVKQKDASDLRSEFEEWAYINNQGRFFNYVHKNKILDQNLMKNYLRKAYPKGDPVSSFLQDPKCTIVDDLTYEPGRPLFIEEESLVKVNQWHLPPITPAPGDITIFEDHLKWLLEDDWEILRNWMAHIIQHPGKRVTYMMLLIGAQGLGKTFIGNCLRKLLGFSNVSEPSNDDIHEKYNLWCAKQIVVIPELMAKGRKELSNKLKSIITDEVVSIHGKHVNPYLIKSCCSILATSNYDVPVLIEKEDRRYCVLKSYRKRHSREEDAEKHGAEIEYYTKLWSWLDDDDNAPVLLDYLLKVDLSNFNHLTPTYDFCQENLN